MTTADDNTNAVSTIMQFMTEKQISAQLGAAFSVFEDSKNNINYIFYRATTESADAKGLGEYIAIDDIKQQSFVTSAIDSMMNRYALESKNGFYGVYVGKEDSGKVH